MIGVLQLCWLLIGILLLICRLANRWSLVFAACGRMCGGGPLTFVTVLIAICVIGQHNPAIVQCLAGSPFPVSNDMRYSCKTNATFSSAQPARCCVGRGSFSGLGEGTNSYNGVPS